MRRQLAYYGLIFLGAFAAQAMGGEIRETRIRSTLDGEPQPIRFAIPTKPTTESRPLLVLLHTWSGGYEQPTYISDLAAACEQRGWLLLAPHFRGPNIRPEACASDLAVQDVLDAVDWISKQQQVDKSRVYLTGASGGGHMTLLLAGRHPERWAGVSAWVPIVDLAAWHAESVIRKQVYAQHMEAACGGKPGDSPTIDAEYKARSPLTYLARAKGLPVDIQAGIHDGHTGSVPVSHTLHAFNLLARENDVPATVVPAESIRAIVATRMIPAGLETEPADATDANRQHKVLLRRHAGPARLTIFEGGHEGDLLSALDWLAQQQRP
jgi:poly(3-hydroxybutyrate) depolymerase